MTLYSLQYLRGIAAMMVVVFHAIIQAQRLAPGYESTGEWPGRGVDVFFVISGFIMWVTTCDRNPGTARFYLNRIVRIVPLYWLLTSFVVAVMIVAPAAMQSGRLDIAHAAASFLFLPATHAVKTDPTLIFPVLVVGWSVNMEMFFYLLFGLALNLEKRLRAVAMIGALVALVGVQAFGPPDGSALKFYTSPFVLEFAAGIALGCAFMAPGWRVPAPLAAIAVAIGFAGLALLDHAVQANTFLSQVLVGMAAALIVGGAVFLEKDRLCPHLKVPRLLGDASYSIYLSHFIVLSAFGQLWRGLHLTALPGQDIAFLVAATLVCAAAGCTLYATVERPITRALKALQGRGPAPLHGVPLSALPGGGAADAPERG